MADGRFISRNNFQFGGIVRREDSVLTISEHELQIEIDKGVHPITKRPMSSLLNHCEPADEATAEMIKSVKVSAPVKKKAVAVISDEDKAKITEIQAEMFELGLAFDRRWGLEKIQQEFSKLKKEKGL